MQSKEQKKRSQHKWYVKNSKVHRRKIKEARLALSDWFLELKSRLECSECGEDHPRCLDFHHKDSSTKVLAVSTMVLSGFSKETILDEINKCDVLCSNCHRKEHWPITRRA